MIFLFAIITIAVFQLPQTSFGIDSESLVIDTANYHEIKKVLQKNPVVSQFLKSQPSSSNEIYRTLDESDNTITKSEYRHEALSLVVSLYEGDREDTRFFVKSYDISYDLPTLGIGVSLSRGQHFESDQTKQAILAVNDLTNPHKQMKKGIPLYQIQCKEGLVPIVKRDRITPACVTDAAWGELLRRGWTPLRIGMPAETNILITYNATMVYPQKVIKEFTSDLPFNMIFWVNNDIVPHTVVVNDGSWSTGQIEPGKIGSIRFNQTGSFTYYILEKPDTSGRIVFEIDETETQILKYNPVLFNGTGTGLQGEELENYIKEKQKGMDDAFLELGVKGLYPITGESFSFGMPAYSLDEWYVGKPIALDIHILKEEFTRETLIKTDELVRKYVGDEIDIVYSKGGYISEGSEQN